MACVCGAYHFKHRMGSFYCWFRKDGSERMLGDDDFWDRNMTEEEHEALVAAKKAELGLIELTNTSKQLSEYEE